MNIESMMGLCPNRFTHAVSTLRFIADHFDRQKCFGRCNLSSGCRNVTTREIDGFNREIYCAVGCLMNDEDRRTHDADSVMTLPKEALIPTHDNRLRGGETAYLDLAFATRRGWSDFLASVQSMHDSLSNPVGINSVTDMEVHRVYRLSYCIHWLCERLADRWKSWEGIEEDMTHIFNPCEQSYLKGIMTNLKEYAARR